MRMGTRVCEAFLCAVLCVSFSAGALAQRNSSLFNLGVGRQSAETRSVVLPPPPSGLSARQAPFATGATLDPARRSRLLALLAKDGEREMFDRAAMVQLGATGGPSQVWVRRLSAVQGKIRAVFGRFDIFPIACAA